MKTHSGDKFEFGKQCDFEQGSHEIRGAFFTDSNELDPAVVTERSKFVLNLVFLWFEPF